jgi:multiple sugar transport system permease protein
VVTSFKIPIDVTARTTYLPGVDFEPTLFNWNYVFVQNGPETWKHFWNSVIIAVGSSTLALIIGSLAAYGLARFSYFIPGLKWKNDSIAFWIISQRILPPAVMVIPFLFMYKTLGLIDTHSGMITLYMVFNLPFVVWIMRDFFNSLPQELEDSARVDGCNRLQAFLRIVLPISTPGLVATYLFCLIFSYNEYLFAQSLTNFTATTMPVFIAGQDNARGAQYWLISAFTLFSVLPVLGIGLFLERYITKGLVVGAVKG